MKKKLIIVAVVGAGLAVLYRKGDYILNRLEDKLDEMTECRKSTVHERVTRKTEDTNAYNFDTDHDR